MKFHRQVDEIWIFGSFVVWEKAERFCNQFNVFLVAGNDKGMKYLFTLFPDLKLVRRLVTLSPAQDSTIPNEQDKVDKAKHDQPDCHPE